MNLNCNEVKFRLDLGKIQLCNKDTEVLKEIEKVFESFSFGHLLRTCFDCCDSCLWIPQNEVNLWTPAL